MSRFKYLVGIVFCVVLIYSTVQAQATHPPITADNLNQVAEIAQFNVEGALHVEWSSDGVMLAVDGQAGVSIYSALAWDDAPQVYASNFATNGVAFSHDRTLMAFSDNENQIRIWNIVTGTQEAVLRNESGVTSMAFSADGTLLVSGSQDGKVRLWSVNSGTLRFTVGESQYSAISSVFFGADDQWIGASGWRDIVQVWDVATGTEREGFYIGIAGVTTVDVSADNSRVASGNFDQIIRVADPAKHTIVAARHVDSPIYTLDFSPDGSLLASGRSSGTVGIWAINENRSVGLEGHASTVIDVAFNPDGTLLASISSDGTVRIWGVPAD